MPSENRVVWIDLLKFFGLLFVILGHINSPASQFIYSWHMPLFFFISGFFVRNPSSFGDVVTFIKKDFNRLMVPYFFFSVVGLFAEVVKRKILGRDSVDIFQSLIGIFYKMNIDGLSDHYGFILWFLSALFFAKLFLYFILLIIKNNSLSALVLSTLLFFSSFYFISPFSLNIACNALFWLSLGYLLSRLDESVDFYNFVLLASLFFLITIFSLSGRIPSLDMARNYYELQSLNVIWALGVIAFLVSGSKLLSSHFNFKFLKIISKYFLLIFIFHPYSNNVAYLIVMKYFDGQWFYVTIQHPAKDDSGNSSWL